MLPIKNIKFALKLKILRKIYKHFSVQKRYTKYLIQSWEVVEGLLAKSAIYIRASLGLSFMILLPHRKYL
jgi:hypothetical protein